MAACFPKYDHARRAACWRLRSTTLRFGPAPALMGVVNVTPDSFSDGGQFLDPARAVEHGLRLVAEGADVLDIGGESTRPYSTPVAEGDELRRVLPVVQALAEQARVPISIDTSKVSVAREAVAAGAQIINDVTGLRDPAMVALARDTQVGVCVMHMQGTPQTMQDAPTYRNVVDEVLAFLRDQRDALPHMGIAVDRICLDPGIGFGKSTQHNLDLLRAGHRFVGLGVPILVGYSRKGFIGKVLGEWESERLAGGLGVALALAVQGVQILRVHDVASVRAALRLFAESGGLAIGGREQNEGIC